MTGEASAQGIARPAGARLVLVSKCKINFDASVYWTGRSEDTVVQIFWLISQLPKECLEDQCVFTNISPDWFLLLKRRFLEKFENDPRMFELGQAVVTAFQDCSIEANPRQSIYEASGSLSCGGDGNTMILSINGSNNTFSSSQYGCSFGNVQMIGTNLTVHIMQFGVGNVAIVTIAGHDIVFTLNQYDGAVYIGTITTPGVHNVTQN